MEQKSLEERKKDAILQEINDELERQEWGGSCEKTTIKLIFKGKFEMMPIEVDQKVKRKPFF